MAAAPVNAPAKQPEDLEPKAEERAESSESLRELLQARADEDGDVLARAPSKEARACLLISWARTIAASPIFNAGIMLIILLNVIVLGLEMYPAPRKQFR